jgi:hypothetical protein
MVSEAYQVCGTLIGPSEFVATFDRWLEWASVVYIILAVPIASSWKWAIYVIFLVSRYPCGKAKDEPTNVSALAKRDQDIT